MVGHEVGNWMPEMVPVPPGDGCGGRAPKLSPGSRPINPLIAADRRPCVPTSLGRRRRAARDDVTHDEQLWLVAMLEINGKHSQAGRPFRSRPHSEMAYFRV